MLSTAAFNALLKTLEEPPSHVVFILCTTDPQKVPETIHSRCQRFDFRRISSEAIVSRLGAICVAEDVEFEGDALDLIAYRAEGGMRNALTSLEQVIAFGEGKVTLENAERLLGSLDTNDMAEIVRFIGTRDIASCFTWTAEYIETGADLAQFTRDLAEHIRNMYVLSLSGTDTVLEVSEATRRELVSEMELFGPDRLARLLGVLGDLSAELRTSTNPRLSFEIALTRMVRPDSDLTLESLAERIEALESGYSAVAHVVSSPAMAQQAASAPMAQQGASAVQAAGGQGAQAPQQAVGSQASQTAQPATAQGASAQQTAQAPATAQVANPVGVTASPAQGAAAVSQASASSFDPAASASGPEPAVEAPVASASPAQPAVAGGLDNPAALQRIWQATLSSIKKAKAAYGVLFLNTKAIYDAERGGIVVEFPTENAFAYNAVQKPEVFEVVKAALIQAAGAEIPFRYAQGAGGAASAGASAASTQPVSQGASAATPAQSAAAPSQAANPVRPAVVPAQSQPVAQAAPAAAPSAYDAPDSDMPPLDAYDDMYVASEADEMASFAAASPTPQPSTAQGASTASASASTAQASASTPAQGAANAQGAAPAADAGDIESILAAGFGEGFTFEEVD